MGKANEVSDTFIIKHPIIHASGDMGQEQPVVGARSLVAATAPEGSASPPMVCTGKQTPPTIVQHHQHPPPTPEEQGTHTPILAELAILPSNVDAHIDARHQSG
jgi:hypothetical protein